jgi:hypothetical protein
MEIIGLGFYLKVINLLHARSCVDCNACNTRKCNFSCQKESDHELDHFVCDNFGWPLDGHWIEVSLLLNHRN